jgi:hypothetical protein
VPSTLSAKTNAKSILSQEEILSPGNRCGEDLIRALSGQLLMVPCSFISAVYGALYLSNSECTDLLPCPLPCSIDSCILPRLQVDRRDSISAGFSFLSTPSIDHHLSYAQLLCLRSKAQGYVHATQSQHAFAAVRTATTQPPRRPDHQQRRPLYLQ